MMHGVVAKNTSFSNGILLQTEAIFFLANLDLNQCIDEVYIMVDFICMGLQEL